MDALHVLSIDGGGMRGLYSATLLRTLTDRFKRTEPGRGFDLIVGTSTGAILAAAIAAGVPLERIIRLYEEAGPRIFTDPIPPYNRSLKRRDKARFWRWACRNRHKPANSGATLESELRDIFGDLTFGELYARRGIALCISATAFLNHDPRVFKTPHVPKKDRDNELLLADACLASSAAPIYLPLASINADGVPAQAFADGGLWANNPVLLGIIEALASSDPSQRVVVLSVGTCPPPVGSTPVELDRGIVDWRAGVLPLTLAMNVQARAAHFASKLLAEQLARLDKKIHILRCEESTPSAEHARRLQLDSASQEALKLMKQLGNQDGQMTYGWCQPDDRRRPDDHRAKVLTQIFERMPEIEQSKRGEG